MTIAIASEDAIWVGRDLYCKTPEALGLALATLREIGYDVQDSRIDGHSVREGRTTPEQMELNGWSLWYASLKDIRKGKCNSCDSLIDTTGIRSHGHTCEVCGEVTYLEMIEGSTIRFSFRGDERVMFGPELNMEVVRWDHEDGWLYLKPEPLEHGGMCVVHGERGQEYLNDHSDKWEFVELEGVQLLKVHYTRSFYVQEDDVISVNDIWGHHWNHKMIKVWDGVEYDEYDRDFPLQESISIYESWHWAPLEPTPTLHERIISAAGQVSRADYYYQDGRQAWYPVNYEVMGVFIRHFTVLDADEWDRLSGNFPLDGPGGIAAVAKFCHPEAVVENNPNIGNFLTVLTGMDNSEAGRLAAVKAIASDPDTQDFVIALHDAGKRT